LNLTKGDIVTVTWSGDANRFALWDAGTTDADRTGCLYAPGWSHWTAPPLIDDTTGSAQTTVTKTGSYPLLFLNTVSSGPFAFTATVVHAASVSFTKQSAIPGAGKFTAAVQAPDDTPISDGTLKLTLNGYWAGRTHHLATATPSAGLATFDYSLPASVWGKKIGLDITGDSWNYQDVASQPEKVKVLIPDAVGPILVPSSTLKTASKLLHQPIYWAGPRKGFHDEFWRTPGNDWIFVRYLPHGVKAGVHSTKFLVVGTYPLADAYGAVKKYCGRKAVAGPHRSIYCPRPASPTSVYIAFPKIDYEIEVYDPSPKLSRAIAASGLVRPVR